MCRGGAAEDTEPGRMYSLGDTATMGAGEWRDRGEDKPPMARGQCLPEKRGERDREGSVQKNRGLGQEAAVRLHVDRRRRVDPGEEREAGRAAREAREDGWVGGCVSVEDAG